MIDLSVFTHPTFVQYIKHTALWSLLNLIALMGVGIVFLFLYHVKKQLCD